MNELFPFLPYIFMAFSALSALVVVALAQRWSVHTGIQIVQRSTQMQLAHGSWLMKTGWPSSKSIDISTGLKLPDTQLNVPGMTGMISVPAMNGKIAKY